MVRTLACILSRFVLKPLGLALLMKISKYAFLSSGESCLPLSSAVVVSTVAILSASSALISDLWKNSC